MAELFRITTEQTEPLTLDGLGRGQFRVRVVNLSGRPLFTTAHIVPQDERVQSWFQIAPPVDRHFAIGASFDYIVNINAQALARPGTYKYRFAMRITDSAGEEPETLSNELTLSLARRILPWRTLLALLLLVIAVGAVIGAFFGSDWLTTNRLAPTITALADDRFFLDRESFELVATIDAQRTRIAEATATLVPQATQISGLEAENDEFETRIGALESRVTGLENELAQARRRVDGRIVGVPSVDGPSTAFRSRSLLVTFEYENVGEVPIDGEINFVLYSSSAGISFRVDTASVDVTGLPPGELRRQTLPLFEIPALTTAQRLDVLFVVPGDVRPDNNRVVNRNP